MVLKSWWDTGINTELVIAFFKEVEGGKPVSAAGNIVDDIPKKLLKESEISNNSTKENIICFEKAKGEAKKKLEESKQQKVAK
jgi:hypothetical protein